MFDQPQRIVGVEPSAGQHLALKTGNGIDALENGVFDLGDGGAGVHGPGQGGHAGHFRGGHAGAGKVAVAAVVGAEDVDARPPKSTVLTP